MTTTAGQVKGVAPGAATITATDGNELIYLPYTCYQDGASCFDDQLTGATRTDPGTTTPTVTFSTVPSVAVGQTATTIATVSPSSNTAAISLSITSPAAIVSPIGTFTQTTAVVVKGMSVGTGTITATVSNSDGGNITVGSTSFPVVPPAPVIQSINPAQGLVGAAQGVTITGSGFSSGTPSLNAPNISVANVSVSSDTQMTATFTPTNSSSAGGNQGVTLSVGGSPASNSKPYYVQVPTHFQFATVSGAPGGKGPVITLTDGTVTNLLGQVYATNFCGVYENFAYEILDQEASPSPILNGTGTVTEVFSNVTNPPGPTPSVNTINFATQGETDIQAYGKTYPTCLATNQNQTLNYSFTVQIGSTVYPLVTVVYYTKGNFNGTLNVTATITTP